MLNKILEQYLQSCQIESKSMQGFRNYEILKTSMQNFNKKFYVWDLDL